MQWSRCTVSLSLFAGPGRILRRFSVLAEEPRKSIITVTEPCNPVFKEAQPRPSVSQSIKLRTDQSNLGIHEVHLLYFFLQETVITVVIKHPTGLCLHQKDLVSSSG